MKRIPVPFDGKGLIDDSLRDEVFEGCYECADMTGRKGHMAGPASVCNDDVCFDAVVDARWSADSNVLRIELLACPCQTDFFSMRDDFFRHYEGIFREWERGMKDNCSGQDDACVEFSRDGNVLYVSFWWIEGN